MNADRPDLAPGVTFFRGCLWALALEFGVAVTIAGLWIVTH